MIDVMIRMVIEKPLGTVGAVITLIMSNRHFRQLPGPLWNKPNDTDYVMVPPSAKFLMGTDNLGRDIFSRVMYGARISVIVGLVATLISVIISTLIGVHKRIYRR